MSGLLDKYLSRTKPNGDCLEWTGCLNTDGYPRAGAKGNSNIKVHREVFFLVNGYYPEVVRHRCDNPICINPPHLEGGTNLDNIKDRHDRNRTHNQVDEELRQKVFALRDQDKSYKEIIREVGVTHKQVDYWLYRRRKES